MKLNPRLRFDFIKDPIHGYIRFTKTKIYEDENATEADLLDSPWLQRLRRIHQLQSAWLVYPGADHSRFIHALGTMHLAGQFARAVYEPFYRRHNGLFEGGDGFRLELPQVEHVVETFRIAGLLHDVGHGPFSHLLDQTYLMPQFQITHEDISLQVIENELANMISGLRRSPEGRFDTPVNPEIVCKLIKKGREQELEGIWRPLHQIMRGAYDADVLSRVN